MIEQLITPEGIALATVILSSLGLYKYIPRLRGGSMPSRESVTEETLEEAIAERYGDEIVEESYFLDGDYYTTSPEGLEQIRSLDPVHSLEYGPDTFDCENYAFMFQSLVALLYGINTVGVVIDFGGSHAYNMIYTNDGDVVLYEPQTDEIVEVGDDLSGNGEESYTLDNSFVMF